jgi:hypothetical protein
VLSRDVALVGLDQPFARILLDADYRRVQYIAPRLRPGKHGKSAG